MSLSRKELDDLRREIPEPSIGAVFAAARDRDWAIDVSAWPDQPWSVVIKRDRDDYESRSRVDLWHALVRAFLAACRGGRDEAWVDEP